MSRVTQASTVAELLALAGVSRREAAILLEAASGVDRVRFIAHPEQVLSAPVIVRYRALHARRVVGEPIAYLVGMREFYGREFDVSAAVLIPRPETELLVELALARLTPGGRVLDLGTGSGALAVTIAVERPDVHVTALDRSVAALAVARRNALRHGVDVEFIESDWFSALTGMRFDLIVANPPYVASNDPHLVNGDLRFEPQMALVSGVDGLDAIRNIVMTAPTFARPGACLLIEHGYDQGAAVAAIFKSTAYDNVMTWPDLQGHPRVSGGLPPRPSGA